MLAQLAHKDAQRAATLQPERPGAFLLQVRGGEQSLPCGVG